MDVRDLGGHLDTTYRAWGCTLAARVLAVLRVVWLVSALPLGYRGRLRILRTMYVPSALHGVEASHLSQSSLFKLRAAFVRACWSSKMTLAHTGTVLGILDGPECVDPNACIVWYRFRLMRRYLAYRPLENARIGRLLELVSGGASGHGPVHLLVESASSLGFQWCFGGFCWNRPGLPQLPMVEGPCQHLQDSILGALRGLNAADLCNHKGFRGGPLLDFRGSMQLLHSSHVRDRDKALLRAILSGGVWNGFLLGKVSADMPRHVSSWTPAAYEVLEAADEPAELEEDAELLIEEEEDPSGWSVSQSASGRPYYWHRSSRCSVWHLPPGASARKKKERRKRKKRRKRRLPRTSSFSSPRRRLRQWHMQGWFCWFLSYAVSPSFGGRPKLPSFMDGMDKMDSFIARRRSWQWQAGLAGIVPRAVSLSLSSGPRCPASWPVWIRSTVMSVLVLFAGECAPRAVFSFPVVRPKMRCIMAAMDQKFSYVRACIVCW